MNRTFTALLAILLVASAPAAWAQRGGGGHGGGGGHSGGGGGRGGGSWGGGHSGGGGGHWNGGSHGGGSHWGGGGHYRGGYGYGYGYRGYYGYPLAYAGLGFAIGASLAYPWAYFDGPYYAPSYYSYYSDPRPYYAQPGVAAPVQGTSAAPPSSACGHWVWDPASRTYSWATC